jgi:hypothetical protein
MEQLHLKHSPPKTVIAKKVLSGGVEEVSEFAKTLLMYVPPHILSRRVIHSSRHLYPKTPNVVTALRHQGATVKMDENMAGHYYWLSRDSVGF